MPKVSHKTLEQQILQEGVKFDGGKPRWDLLPFDVLNDLAMLYAKGAEKYEDRNWEKGMDWSRVFGAMLRHAHAFWERDDIDEETGMGHIIAVIWNAMALAFYSKHNIGKDDRPVKKGMGLKND